MHPRVHWIILKFNATIKKFNATIKGPESRDKKPFKEIMTDCRTNRQTDRHDGS